MPRRNFLLPSLPPEPAGYSRDKTTMYAYNEICSALDNHAEPPRSITLEILHWRIAGQDRDGDCWEAFYFWAVGGAAFAKDGLLERFVAIGPRPGCGPHVSDMAERLARVAVNESRFDRMTSLHTHAAIHYLIVAAAFAASKRRTALWAEATALDPEFAMNNPVWEQIRQLISTELHEEQDPISC